MRTRKTWTGVFHCGLCKVEEDLDDEGNLECEECGERLVPGPLFEDEHDGDGPDEQEVALNEVR